MNNQVRGTSGKSGTLDEIRVSWIDEETEDEDEDGYFWWGLVFLRSMGHSIRLGIKLVQVLG